MDRHPGDVQVPRGGYATENDDGADEVVEPLGDLGAEDTRLWCHCVDTEGL